MAVFPRETGVTGAVETPRGVGSAPAMLPAAPRARLQTCKLRGGLVRVERWKKNNEESGKV